MILKDYHVHTTFSDGKNTMEEVVVKAIEKGLKEIGFSDHSYTFFDTSYCVKRSDIPTYLKEAERLRAKFGDKIKIKIGVEQDVYSRASVKNYEYAIGSVHYFKIGKNYYPLDESKERFVKIVEEFFGGDYYLACENYFAAVEKFSERSGVNIIGHFDLVSKYNGDGSLFDEDSERYVAAYKRAAKKLVEAGKVFEINTGTLRKGLRPDAYPKKAIRDYIKSLGGKFILSSNSHKKEDLLFGVELFEGEL
ncbi:MAG: histidinol-phosphatase, partial [Clostridia bacterium]|nr:histidinol-phosphatase [Clostridia bacterium]